MREIEFRFWNKEKKVMCYDNEDKTSSLWDGVYFSDVDMVNNIFRYNSKYPEYEVMQYTGLKDKNGTKIYEGDIVKYTRKNMYAPTASFHNQDIVSLHKICWNEEKHAFYQQHYKIESKQCKCIGGGSLNFNDERAEKNIIEVIGNIYDNPELIKE